jgi:hypothetical protein
MRTKLTYKSAVNIQLETDKGYIINNRDRTFIKSCVKELKERGTTICFKEWHVKELQKLVDIKEVCYDERNDCYYLFSKA